MACKLRARRSAPDRIRRTPLALPIYSGSDCTPKLTCRAAPRIRTYLPTCLLASGICSYQRGHAKGAAATACHDFWYGMNGCCVRCTRAISTIGTLHEACALTARKHFYVEKYVPLARFHCHASLSHSRTHLPYPTPNDNPSPAAQTRYLPTPRCINGYLPGSPTNPGNETQPRQVRGVPAAAVPGR